MVKQSTQRTPQQQIINTEIYLAFQAEAGRAEMEDKIDQLKQAEQQLQKEKWELEVKMERSAKRSQEELEAVKRQHAEEVEALRQSNMQLKVGYSSKRNNNSFIKNHNIIFFLRRY